MTEIKDFGRDPVLLIKYKKTLAGKTISWTGTDLDPGSSKSTGARAARPVDLRPGVILSANPDVTQKESV
jgi:hypothetical protein